MKSYIQLKGLTALLTGVYYRVHGSQLTDRYKAWATSRNRMCAALSSRHGIDLVFIDEQTPKKKFTAKKMSNGARSLLTNRGLRDADSNTLLKSHLLRAFYLPFYKLESLCAPFPHLVGKFRITWILKILRTRWELLRESHLDHTC